MSLVCALVPLASCANGPLADTFQRSIAADPRLSDNPDILGTPSTSTTDTSSTAAVQLPATFPVEIPRYPGAQLLEVMPLNESTASTPAGQTRWSTPDRADQVRNFYQTTFQANDWQTVPPVSGAGNSPTLVVERDGLRVTVGLEPPPGTSTSSPTPTAASQGENQSSPAPGSSDGTTFTLTYSQANRTTAEQIATPQPMDGNATRPQPGEPGFIGPTPSNNPTQINSPSSTPSSAQTFTDINQAPEELRPYIEDLGRLGVLASNAAGNSGEFKPNAVITRREYARWLVAANNAIYANRPAQKIRLGVNTASPIFQDVPRNDPDFAAIQGLAEAGLIPSSLAGDATTVTFRPNAPLTRESLILWKAPMDSRQTLPNATVQAVQQTWGFQDSSRIDPRALRAVLADYQNGDLANIRRAFGYTTLFQPKKTVTRAEAAAALWYFGSQGDGISARDAAQAQQN